MSWSIWVCLYPRFSSENVQIKTEKEKKKNTNNNIGRFHQKEHIGNTYKIYQEMNECMNTDKIMCKERHNTHDVPETHVL